MQDRARENLVSSDNNIIMMRNRLLEAASAVAAGTAPPGLKPETQGARAVSMVAPRGLSLSEALARADQDRR